MRNNRTAGHNFERDMRKWWRSLGWEECETSRYANRKLDDEKVDLTDTDPFQVQCKYTQSINMHTVISEMPDNEKYNLVFHKRKNKGTVVAMSVKTFEELIKMLKTEEVL